MRTLILLFLILLGLFQYALWFQPGGIPSLLHLHHQIAQQEKINKNVSQQNDAIKNKIISLKQGQSAVETLARKQLGMIKKGEQYYQFVQKKA